MGGRQATGPVTAGCRTHSAPHVDDVLAAELEAAVCLVRRAEDQDVALLEDAVQGHEAVVDDVRIGGQDAGACPRQQLAQLVAERRARVVGLGLEGHPEDAHGLAVQAAVAALERGHDEGGQALVDLHRGLAEREVVGGEGRQLHRVLEQARTGGEARARAGRPRAGSPRGSRAGCSCSRRRRCGRS